MTPALARMPARGQRFLFARGRDDRLSRLASSDTGICSRAGLQIGRIVQIGHAIEAGDRVRLLFRFSALQSCNVDKDKDKDNQIYIYIFYRLSYR